jgi:rhodanese-related sulfurtransferase
MSTAILREEVERLVRERGAQLVEVLDEDEYRRQHLLGALNIPLRRLAVEAGRLDRARPVVVYCFDALCDLSPRAVARLDSLGGFTEVYDYVAGKVDWVANGLPCYGEESVPRLAGVTERDMPVVRLDDVGGDIDFGDAPTCAVVDENGVLLGEVRRGDTAMREGPPTYRPDVALAEMAEELAKSKATYVWVTYADGRLLGLADVARIRERAPHTHAA